MYHLTSMSPFFLVTLIQTIEAVYYGKNFDCGPYGFTCEGASKLRLCEGDSLFGPTFNCPANTFCNEDTSEVCENSINHIDPALSKGLRCRRNERLADPTVPGCKGYILCIPNKNRFQGIKFKCSGDTVFNGITRTCSSAESYTCPLPNSTKSAASALYEINRRSNVNRGDILLDDASDTYKPNRAIDCKNYNFRVTQDGKPARVTYFCPARPAPGERATRCTVFSNQFCITLERDDKDQFALSTGLAYRKPRRNNLL